MKNNCVIVNYNYLHGLTYYIGNGNWIDDKSNAMLMNENRAINTLNSIGVPFVGDQKRYVYNIFSKK